MATEIITMHTRELAARKADDAARRSRNPVKSPLTFEQRQILIEYLPLVSFLARRIHCRVPHHLSVEDLASAGTVGLMDAVTKFDAARNTSFSQYAQFRIRGAIFDSLRSLDWGSKQMRRKSRELLEVQQALTARLRRSPDEAEVAAGMGLTLDAYHQLVAELDGLHVASLHETRCSYDSEEEAIDFIPARAEEGPLFQCLRGELTDRMADAIDNLPEREKTLVKLYYYEEMSMREIGIVLNVSEGRVSQMHGRALHLLRAALKDMAGATPAKCFRSPAQSIQ
jgi:RNA polymerase sigma factor FliA